MHLDQPPDSQSHMPSVLLVPPLTPDKACFRLASHVLHHTSIHRRPPSTPPHPLPPNSVPSKVNPITDRVPTTALTVTLARVALAWVVNALGEHATVVPDVHDAVPHKMSPE